MPISGGATMKREKEVHRRAAFPDSEGCLLSHCRESLRPQKRPNLARSDLIVLGLVVFAVGIGILGIWLRRHPSKENAEKTSRIVHFLFFLFMVAPPLIGIFSPGLTHFDELLGLIGSDGGPPFWSWGSSLQFQDCISWELQTNCFVLWEAAPTLFD